VLVMGGRLVDLQASDAGPGVVRPRAQCTGLARCVSGPRLAPKRHANLPTPFPSTRNGLFSRFPTPGCGIAAGIQAALPRSAIPVYAVNRRHPKKQSSKTSTCAFRRWSRSLMPKLPRISSRRLLQVLLRAGFYVHHQTGSHVNLRHCTKSHLHVVVPRHSRDLAPKTIKSVIIQAEMTVEELARLLGA